MWRAIALAVGLNVHGLFAQILEDSIRDTRLEFPWPLPAGSQRLRAFFSCQLKFNARAFAFEVPRQLCGLPSPFADPGLHAKALEALQMTGGGNNASLSRTVESLIAMHLPRRLGEENAARLLGLTRRTFVRRLADTGVGFRGLLDGVLRERASAMSAAGRMSREEMAAALGYADATSLSRACRRWFGSGPRGACLTSSNISDARLRRRRLHALLKGDIFRVLVQAWRDLSINTRVGGTNEPEPFWTSGRYPAVQ